MKGTFLSRNVCILLIGLFLISSISASVLCEKINVQLNNSKTSDQVRCVNNGNETVTLSSSMSSLIVSPTSISPGNNPYINFLITPNTPDGNYNGQVTFSNSNNSPSIVVNINLQSVQEIKSPIIIFPTSKIINVQQGQTKTQSIQVIIPSTYPRPVTFGSPSFNPDRDVIRFGDLDLGTYQPGQSFNIPLVIDAKNVQTDTYNTKISILATDSTGQIPVSQVDLQVIVSVGVSSTTNETFGTRPICSLSSIQLSLNGTYSFTCNNVISNIDVSPQYNEYLEGIRAETGLSGNYIYTFKAIKLGKTTFVSLFNYKNSPIFSPYTQEIRITPSGGSVVSGTSLRFEFSQNGNAVDYNQLTEGQATILMVDNSTNSVVPDYTLYLNNIQVNNTLTLQANKVYQLRASSVNYLDSVINFSITPKKIQITLNPDKSEYSVGDVLNITTDVNASLLLDDSVITSPYSLSLPGVFTIKAIKEGYNNSERNITVKGIVGYNSVSPLVQDWKKGSDVTITLNQNVTWEVDLIKSDNTMNKLNSGTGNLVTFKLNDYGTYQVKSAGSIIFNYNLENKSFFSRVIDSIGSYWYWYLGGAVLLIFLFIYRRSSGGGEESNVGFSMTPSQG